MDDDRYLDSMGNEIDPDELGEEITEAQSVVWFDQQLAAWRSMISGFAAPVEGEPLPLLGHYNLPIVNDALRQVPEYLLEFASLGVLFAADYLRTHGGDAPLVLG